jgi:hypothetical protein
MRYSHAELGYGNAGISVLQPVAILPDGLAELGTGDQNTIDGDARPCLDRLYKRVDSRVEAEYQACIVPVEHKVATSD